MAAATVSGHLTYRSRKLSCLACVMVINVGIVGRTREERIGKRSHLRWGHEIQTWHLKYPESTRDSKSGEHLNVNVACVNVTVAQKESHFHTLSHY